MVRTVPGGRTADHSRIKSATDSANPTSVAGSNGTLRFHALMSRRSDSRRVALQTPRPARRGGSGAIGRAVPVRGGIGAGSQWTPMVGLPRSAGSQPILSNTSIPSYADYQNCQD